MYPRTAQFNSPSPKASNSNQGGDYSLLQQREEGNILGFLHNPGSQPYPEQPSQAADLWHDPYLLRHGGHRWPDQFWERNPGSPGSHRQRFQPFVKDCGQLQCIASDKTTAVNAANAVALSGSSIVVPGRGTM